MKVFLTTGTDANVFANTLILAESCLQICGVRVQVCDFGMTAAQVELLSRFATVVPRPDELAELDPDELAYPPLPGG